MTDWNSSSNSDSKNSKNKSRRSSNYKIDINFIAIEGDLPDFTIYRQSRTDLNAPKPQTQLKGYRLPKSPESPDDWQNYWISVDPIEGFEAFVASERTNLALTRYILFSALLAKAQEVLDTKDFNVPRSRFIEEISFVQRTHDEGDELLVVQPYHLKATKQFGFLVDFHFDLREGVSFSRKVQQLSLSLDRNFRRNLDCYVDRSKKINSFLQERWTLFSELKLPGGNQSITFNRAFVSLPAERLTTKVYLFAGNRDSKSQFMGLRNYGPLKQLEGTPRLLFVFREQDRNAARLLAKNLQGSSKRNRFSFPGFKALFKCDPNIDRNPIVVPNLERASIEEALEQVKQKKEESEPLVPIFVIPEDDDSYLVQKSLFTHEGIATQVCTLRILKDEDSLKWAIANIALQIFCKAGGYPWKVRPTAEQSLIIGISQSHKVKEIQGNRIVEKYFAFSVMTDSSGLFQKIQVLAEDKDHGTYLDQIRSKLREILIQSAQEFSRVVIHTSFKLKYKEIDAIQQTVEDAAKESNTECKFAVVKVNQKSRFFGVNRDVNSLVPYEATKARLGPREYLIWFEGIFPDKTTVNKAFPGPTHIQIMRTGEKNELPDETLLQDLVNLSGANWRGFNAKSAPVSVFYCHLVADFVHDFHERNLPLPAVEDIRPWFL